MPPQSDTGNLSVGQFAERHRREMIPLAKPFAYLSASFPLTDEDVREYLEEPIAALPPSIASQLPKINIVLVPYLEKSGTARNGAKSSELITTNKPTESRLSWSSCLVSKEEAVLAFALKDQEMADYHYRFYRALAELLADQWSEEARRQFASVVRDELNTGVHGEVDESSWHYKQSLVRRNVNVRRDSKGFRDYVRHSFIDTLTLYLHGICCDIDVEAGPRQLQSRYLRRRLKLLQSLYPPPQGYAVFPEELKHHH